MTDVQTYRDTLEKFIAAPDFGEHIISSHLLADPDTTAPCLLINGEKWRISGNPERIDRAEVALDIPDMSTRSKQMFAAMLLETIGQEAKDSQESLFYQCWNNGGTSEVCASELRQKLEKIIDDFEDAAEEWRVARAEGAAGY